MIPICIPQQLSGAMNSKYTLPDENVLLENNICSFSWKLVAINPVGEIFMYFDESAA